MEPSLTHPIKLTLTRLAASGLISIPDIHTCALTLVEAAVDNGMKGLSPIATNNPLQT